MSADMQGRNRSQQQDSSASSHASSTTHSPQQWFRPSFNRSLPNVAKAQHQNRALGFSSIRDLARTSRRPLATLSTNTLQPPNQTLRASNSLYGTLRDQCSPPPPPVPELPAPSAVVLRRSHSSSANSFTPDQSGVSTNTTHLTTPSPAKQSTFYELETSPTQPPKSMGNKTSSIARKPHSVKGKHSIPQFDGELEKSSDLVTKESETVTKDPTTGKKPPATFSARGSPPAVQVPRRRSSLTVLHLDNSHFETHDPKQPNSQHTTNTLIEPLERRPSTLAETIRPVISNAATLTPATVAQNCETTLSPPLLSPTSRISSASSQSPSMAPPSVNSRNSVIGAARIHLPRTFPEGPVPIPVPKLTQTHYQCFACHKHIFPSKNSHCPVPCMTCAANPPDMWKCSFCYLRICPRCMSGFEARKRNLEGLMDWLAIEKDKKQGMKEGGTDGIETEDFALKGEGDETSRKEGVEKAMEEAAAKKAETARKRETR